MAGGVLVAGLPWLRRHVAAVLTVLVVLIGFNWILALWSLPSFEQYKPVVPLSRAIRTKGRSVGRHCAFRGGSAQHGVLPATAHRG
jgi:hypothetical protein